MILGDDSGSSSAISSGVENLSLSSNKIEFCFLSQVTFEKKKKKKMLLLKKKKNKLIKIKIKKKKYKSKLLLQVDFLKSLRLLHLLLMILLYSKIYQQLVKISNQNQNWNQESRLLKKEKRKESLIQFTMQS